MNLSEYYDIITREFDLKTEECVQLLKGDVHKKKNVIHDVKQHNFDVANSKPQSDKDVLSIMGELTKPK